MLQEVVNNRLSLSQRRWLIKQGEESHIHDISRRFSVGESAARLLATRDIDDIENFLRPTLQKLLPDPYIFADMQKAVECIYDAMQAGEVLVLYGDYDVDGGSSTAMLADYFKTIGHDRLQIYIPDRFAEGYGVNCSAIDNFHKEGRRVMITMDCGTASFDALKKAKDYGMQVVVLDHHKPETEDVGAYAFVNPNRNDSLQDSKVREDYGHLAAVGVTFLFMVAFNRHLRQLDYFNNLGIDEPDLRQFLDLVALGTVCDVVPLRGINRAFVRHGLRIMGEKNSLDSATGRFGLQKLCAVSKISNGKAVTAMDLGFSLGPRLNAASRMGESSLAVKLLMSCDEDESVALSYRLDELNKQRRDMQEQHLAEALQIAKKLFEENSERSHIVIASAGWQIGLVGILAARLKDLYHVPCIVIGADGDGIGRGSGRSVAGFDLGEVIMRAAREGILLNGGGHAMAAGLSIDLSKVGELDRFLGDYISTSGMVVCRDLEVDLSLSLGSLRKELWQELDLLEPFGSEHGVPIVLFNRVRVGDIKILDGGHVSCRLYGSDGFSARGILFGGSVGVLGAALLRSGSGDKYDIVGKLSRPYGNSEVGSVMIDDMVKL